MARACDYQAEYERRVARGRWPRLLAKPGSRPSRDRTGSCVAASNDARFDPILEEGLREIREGSTLKSAARRIGVSNDRLSRYVAGTGVGVRDRGRWQIGLGRRPRRLPMYSRGRTIAIIVPGYDEAVLVGRYMAATAQSQATNDPLVLASFQEQGVRDIRGQFHPFETDPDTLYRVMAAGPEPFEVVYRILV